MKTLTTIIFTLAVLLAACSDDNTVNNNNNNQSDIIFSQSGLIDSIYNTTGSLMFDMVTLDTIQFTNYNHINIKVKLNGFGSFNGMNLHVITCDTCGMTPFFARSSIGSQLIIDTTIVSPAVNGRFGVFIVTTEMIEWVSVRDLQIRKTD